MNKLVEEINRIVSSVKEAAVEAAEGLQEVAEEVVESVKEGAEKVGGKPEELDEAAVDGVKKGLNDELYKHVEWIAKTIESNLKKIKERPDIWQGVVVWDDLMNAIGKIKKLNKKAKSMRVSEGLKDLHDLVEEVMSDGISEAKRPRFDPDVIRKIKRLTSINDHQTANFLGARMLGAKKLEKKFSLIAQLADLDVGLDGNLSKYASSAYENMMSIAKRDLSDEEYEAFHGAF